MVPIAIFLAGSLFGDLADTYPQPTEGTIALFDVCECRYTGGQYQDELFRYRLFVPRAMKPRKRYPLLVWLHGAGENGVDNQKSLRWLNLVFNDCDHVEQYRFFVLVVQCPPANPCWYGSLVAAQADDMVNVAAEILRKTMREYPVDQDRVYLSGISSGGNGCWEMALRYPELFAAVVPIASGGGDVSRAAKLVHIPIWPFHSLYDSGTPPAGVGKMVAAVQQAGGNAHLTLQPSADHVDCLFPALQQSTVDWMLDQRRGSWVCWTPPGHRAWKWWHVFGVPGAFLVLVCLGWYSERSRRRVRRARDCRRLENA